MECCFRDDLLVGFKELRGCLDRISAYILVLMKKCNSESSQNRVAVFSLFVQFPYGHIHQLGKVGFQLVGLTVEDIIKFFEEIICPIFRANSVLLNVKAINKRNVVRSFVDRHCEDSPGRNSRALYPNSSECAVLGSTLNVRLAMSQRSAQEGIRTAFPANRAPGPVATNEGSFVAKRQQLVVD